MEDTYVHLTMVSDNAKTGPIPVSTTSATTCPGSCPLNTFGLEQPDREHRRAVLKAQGLLPCYAAKGPLALHWGAVTRGERGMGWDAFCSAVAALPEGQLWRHNQAGDLPGQGETIDGARLQALSRANRGRRGFTFTHKPVGVHGVGLVNLFAISRAVADGFAINLSANSLDHADRLSYVANMVLGPQAQPRVVTLLPKGHPPKSTTPAGRKVLACLEQTGKARNCKECGLCQSMDPRRPIIGFYVH